MACFTSKKSCTIRPAYPTWTGRVALTELDQAGTTTHMPTIYFYNKPSESFKGNVVETLKNSLSRALIHFYPMAGRLQWLPGGRFELECNAEGVEFVEAESEANLSDFNDFAPTWDLEDLMPQVNFEDPIETIPLFLAQLTKFKCGGLGLGVSFSHVIVDGQSALHFLSEWGRLARGEPLETVPFLDRKVLWAGEPLPPFASPPQFDHKEFDHAPFLIGETDSVEERMKKTTVAMLKLTKTQLDKLRSKVNESEYADPERRFTRYETITGHVWRCACKARGHSSEQLTALGICIDVRSRMQPPLPRSYFGNAILDVVATSTSGELTSKELGFAVGKIRETIKNVTSEYVKVGIEFLKRQKNLRKFQELNTFGNTEGHYFGNPNLALVSWLTLPVTDLDFGWGKEIYMGPGMPDFDGDSLILPDQNGDGSVVIAKCLQVAHMEEFKKHIYGDI